VGNSKEMNANIDADATLLRAVNTRSRRKCEQSKQNETGVGVTLNPGDIAPARPPMRRDDVTGGNGNQPPGAQRPSWTEIVIS